MNKQLIQEAIKYPKIKDLSNEIIISELEKIISEVFLVAGIEAKEEQSSVIIKTMLNDVLSYFKTLSTQEIYLCLTSGVKGFYGDYFGLNAATFFKWLNNYRISEERMKIIKEVNKPKELPGLSEESKERIVYDAALQKWEDFKEGKQINDFGNVTYNYLDSKKIIPFSIERKKQIMKQVQEKMLKEKTYLMQKCADTMEKTAINNQIDSILTGKDAALISQCKIEALKLFFADLKEVDGELKDMLNN